MKVWSPVTTCLDDHIVCLKVFNPGNETIFMQRVIVLAKFELSDNSIDIIALEKCAQITVSKQESDISQRPSTDDMKCPMGPRMLLKIYFQLIGLIQDLLQGSNLI